jgi:hypothetical protein
MDSKTMDGYDIETFLFMIIPFLFGKMKPTDKDAEMNAFLMGKLTLWLLQLLLKLVNVPNASVMIIEVLERFGLSSSPVAVVVWVVVLTRAIAILTKTSSDSKTRVETW